MRITDMRGVDIERYRFDFDLTFGVMTLHADGTVYHRYGGRDSRSPSHWNTPASFARMLKASLGRHRIYASAPAPPTLPVPLQPEKIPAFARRDKGACIHCHNVHEGLVEESKDQGTWSFEDIWVHPSPTRLGFDLDRDEQRLITRVDEGSAAFTAGLQPGDVLLELGETPIATASDVMFACNEFPAKGGQLAVKWLRAGKELSSGLPLEAGWKRTAPVDFAWRAIKWTLDPVPGFGGPMVPESERKALGLAPENTAFRIQYFVTWGPRAHSGKRAGRAGLRAGDIVVEVAGKRDFQSIDHFHAWWRLTRQPGEVVPIHVVRDGQRRVIELRVPEE